MRGQRNRFQMKEQDKNPTDELNEVETSDQPNREFEVVIIKIKELKRRPNEQNEKLEILNKELEKYKEPSRAEEYNY